MIKRFAKRKVKFLILTLLLTGSFGGCSQQLSELLNEVPFLKSKLENVQSLENLPTYDGQNMVVSVNDNQPMFSDADLSLNSNSWQTLSDLDGLNRVGPANAMLHRSMMPSYKRGDISSVYPSGWNQQKLDGDQYLYDRCHLIGFQLTGEDANWKNLFTGTAQMNRPNKNSMLEYETIIADYLRNTENHVRYRVTPCFVAEELVCRGVQLEAKSVEDDRISFNVFVFNVNDSVTIDYATGRVVN